MAFVRVEGVLGCVLVAAEWRDGKVTGNPVLLRAIEQAAGGRDGRCYADPLAFAALAARVVERWSDRPARIVAEGVAEPIERGMAGIAA